jgi:hypothetical protein
LAIARSNSWRIAADDPLADRLRQAARQWVEQNFNAHRNAGRIRQEFDRAIAKGAP